MRIGIEEEFPKKLFKNMTLDLTSDNLSERLG